MMVLLKNKILLLGFGAVIIVLAGGGYILWQKNIKVEQALTETTQQQQEAQQKAEQINNSQSVFAVPDTSASAITSPPPSMVGINTHTEVYGTGPDPNMITLGPKLGIPPEKTGYATKHSMAWELKIHGTPVLAPIDMVLVGFQNDSVTSGIGADGQNTPHLIICSYFSSLPVLIGRV